MKLQEIRKLLDNINENSEREVITSVCREVLVNSIYYIYDLNNVNIPRKASLLELIDGPVINTYINDADILKGIHYVRIISANASHNLKIRKKEAELCLLNIKAFLECLESKLNGVEYHSPVYMSEAATRSLYIDTYLREAGWEVLDDKGLIMPGKACVEIEVTGMPNPHGLGYCDYVLYGRNGKPLAIVEAKKTSTSPDVGRHQVDLYGECMKAKYGYKPVLYYTNGYSIKIIDGLYPDRTVYGFNTIDELELLIQKRDRKPITDITIDDNISNRPYQKMAITSMCEWFNSNHRRGLLVMATGTGKTRTAISLVDILVRNNWIKNVLFLADRTTLVSQARRNFAKLLPSMSICELSDHTTDIDYTARLMFSTYQTMINYIDAEEKEFSVGRFDLIIIDEAHRSIFNRYGTIFNYFDSLLVGLTATPKNEVDANTYSLFGCEAGVPNFDYSLEQAIKDKYLVGYKVINKESELLTGGIDWNKLTDEQKRQLEDFVDSDDPPTPDFTIPSNKIFKYIFNKNTCDQVLNDLMSKGYRTNGGEKIGKSIIFAYNHHHAQMIVDSFHQLYPELPANTCQLVDNYVNYSKDLVLKFDSDEEFRIAVSVDMLDTGVDIQSVLNLVFFKPVRSKIKFVQMIGRGTRLCENIYGNNRDKDSFLIFDYCGNFEFFDQYIEKTDGKEMLTLSQRLFNAKLNLLSLLQKLSFQQDAWYKSYYQTIKTQLHDTVVKIKSHDSRIQVRESMDYVDKYYDINVWTSLSSVQFKEIKNHLTRLVDSGANGQYLSVAFDVRILSIEYGLLQNQKDLQNIKNVRLVCKYLIDEKASVPQVLDNVKILQDMASDGFWDNVKVSTLEEYRVKIRDLMQFLVGPMVPPVDVDIHDVLTDSPYQPESTNIDIRTYKEKVLDYLSDNFDNPVISKIFNLQQINSQDLKELENILWNELGSEDDYKKTTDQLNLAAFIRSLIGLNQVAINEKFSDYLSDNNFNSMQQQFIKEIIEYCKENGDIELNDLIEQEPFIGYDGIQDLFGTSVQPIINLVNVLHGVVIC